MHRLLCGLLAAALLLTEITATVNAEPSFAAQDNDTYVPSIDSTASDAGNNLATDISAQPLSQADEPRTTLTSLGLPYAASKVSSDFVIHASSPISSVTKTLMPDNRLVLDFDNAGSSLDDQYNVVNPVVERVRTGIYEDTMTRVVFDLKAGASFSVSISDDRLSLTVSFMVNTIKALSFRESGDTDIIEIEGEYRPYITIKPVTGENQIALELPLALLNVAVKSRWITNLHFVNVIHTEQVDSTTARVVMDSRGMASMSVSYDGNRAFLELSPATFHNIYYGTDHTLKLKRDSQYPVDMTSFDRDDWYNSLEYIVTLPGDYSAWLGYGQYIINDDFFNSVEITTSQSGNRQLIFHEKQVLCYDITQDNEYIYIHAVTPKEKYNKIVIIDPGHGGSDPGAIANGLTEKTLNLDTALRVKDLLNQNGSVKVYLTRNTDIAVDLYDRPAWANQVGDLFVSIHMNAMGNRSQYGANGTEVYYYPHDNDEALGFSGEQLASILDDNLVSTLGSYNRGVLTNRFVVIKYTTIPSALVEVGFLTNSAESDKLSTEEYREKAAQAISQSILEAFSEYTPRR
jgi:N-acetylmuramoyl-L-alanine amidase